MAGDRLTIVTVNLADSGGHTPKDVYICDYCGALVILEWERVHDEIHRRHYDPPLVSNIRSNREERHPKGSSGRF